MLRKDAMDHKQGSEGQGKSVRVKSDMRLCVKR